ncbi:hypothetical protein EWM64_g8394 [Hericium alpestre]|uniref:Uncharacterized protein n=1 Tax=Hericium alpestre TaxID=135208 RepID=A0A4Y9ZNJ3_9AGAM|nr:hypothetical protein EWM64_g8394 [Hericium alpestre]
MEARKAIWSATMMSYMALDVDATAALKANAETYSLSSAFKNEIRYVTLSGKIRTTCTAIRNHYRTALKESVFGNHKSSLQETCLDLSKKYGFLKDNEEVPPGNQVRVLLLRRFVRENPELVNHSEAIPDSEELVNTAGAEAEESDSESGEARKRRKTNQSKSKKVGGGGRPVKGAGFWARVDSWLEQLVADLGCDLGATAWKQYIEETLKMDKDHSAGVKLSLRSLLSLPQAVPQLQRVESPTTQAETPRLAQSNAFW